MDKFSYLKNDKQTIYDIYRACRLCGGGAGYKMPIVQNVIDLDTNGVELKQKIQECLQIEVHQDDKMPPLICELCVDKVNDFYEFMEMCRQTNKRTRLRLGLPLHAAKKSTSDSGDCILGVTEPIYETEDDNEPLSKQLKSSKKKEIKKEKLDEQLSKKKDVGKKNFKEVKIKEAEVKVKTEKVTESPLEPRKRRAAGAPSPHAHAKSDDSVKPSAPKTSSKAKPNSPHPVKASLRRELKELLDVKVQYKDEDSSRMKRAREKDPVVEKKAEKAEVPAKKVKIAAAPKSAAVPKPTTAPKPAAALKPAAAPKPAAARKPPGAPRPAPPARACALCPYVSKSGQGLATHVRVHVVTFTNDKLACNPCGEWFSSNEESSAHHKKHKTKPYRCRHCYSVFKMMSDYDKHFAEEDCKPYTEVPDKRCDDCWRTYPTQLLLDQHRCQGPDGRPGGKCLKCNRMYTLLKNLKKHEATCTFRKKGEAIVDPNVEKRLRVTQILLMRCDDVLHRTNGGSYDVSNVDTDFGFDYRYVYPYRYRVKPEPNTGYDTMVSIGDEVKAHYSRDYVHWDSDDTDSDGDVRKIDSLSAISLKTIFSNKLLGKVPKRRRKVKVEKVFDNVDFDMSKDIDSIILNLGQDDVKKNDSANDSDCSESIFGPFKQNDAISENAFDNLLAENDSQDTEKNFDLFNSSGENKDSLNDFEKVNSQINDKEDSQAATNNSIDSGVKNDDEKYDDDSPVDRDNDLEYKENDNASTDTNVIENNDNMSQNTEFSESQNQMDSDDARTGTPIDDTSQNIVKDNDNVDNLEIDSNKPISVTNEDVESASVIDNNEKVEDAAKDNYDSTNVDTPKENIEESSEESNVKVNGQDINSLANYSSDVEMDDKKLMDAIDEQIGENFTNGDENHVENNTVSKDTDDSEFKIVNSDSKTDDFNENNGEIGDKSSVIENSGISDEQNEKVTDLVSKRHSNLRGMDLDNISDDEFNFDA